MNKAPAPRRPPATPMRGHPRLPPAPPPAWEAPPPKQQPKRPT